MKLVVFILCILMIPSVLGATIQGTVYDFSLEPTQAIVIIDTIPQQTMVAQNGSYKFSVPEGDYHLSAEIRRGGEVTYAIQETITVPEKGEFILDLILFPTFPEEDIPELVVEIPSEKNTSLWVYIIVIVVIIGIALFLRFRKKTLTLPQQDIPEDNLVKDVLSFIRQQNGRTTQKDIRNHFPSSEAAISLVLTQLEHEGKIKKIKKGRGNVIIATAPLSS